MLKDKHLKMYIDRLMLVPRKSHEAHESKGPSLIEGIHEKEEGISPLMHEGKEMDSDPTEKNPLSHMIDSLGKPSHEVDDPDHGLDDMGGADDLDNEKPMHQGDLSPQDHEKRVKMERARHARIFGGH